MVQRWLVARVAGVAWVAGVAGVARVAGVAGHLTGQQGDWQLQASRLLTARAGG